MCCAAFVLQVFRTYNASITLDRLLFEMEEGGGVGHHGKSYCSRTLEAKKADYDRANKEVIPRPGAVVCARLADIDKHCRRGCAVGLGLLRLCF
jgi:hypothetical protein